MLLEYDMVEPSKSPWACEVVMAIEKGGQLRFCCDFCYLNAVTIKDANPIPRIDESLSRLGDANFFLLHWIWVLPSGRFLCETGTERRLGLHANWVCSSGRRCLCLVQCHGDLSKTDGSGFNQDIKEVLESRDVLRG